MFYFWIITMDYKSITYALNFLGPTSHVKSLIGISKSHLIIILFFKDFST